MESVDLFDLSEVKLPHWEDGMRDGNSEFFSETYPKWEPLKSSFEKADAIIFITPEWSGMASPALKNMILY